MAAPKRRFSSKLKLKVVLEVLAGEKSPAQIAKAYGVHPNSVVLWKKTLLERGAVVFEGEAGPTNDRRIAELEQLLGKKEVEIALLKNFLGRSE